MPSQRGSAQRRHTASQNDHVYDLGKVGRKTGITLQERDRDEQGFEDMDIFSSPEKDANGNYIPAASEDEQDMEIDDESQMGPATMMKQRQERLSLPRARSPIKTNLQSPARQNPHLAATSSPTRGSIVTSRERSPPKVSRRLDFSKSSQNQMRPPTNGQRKVNGTKARNGNITDSPSQTEDSDDDDESILNEKPRQPEAQEDEEDEDEVDQMRALDVEGDDGDLPGEDPEPEPVPEEDDSITQQLKNTSKPKAGKRKGRPKKATPPKGDETEASPVEEAPAPVEEVEEAEDEPVKKKRGRRPKTSQSPPKAEPSAKASKRRKHAEASVEETEEPDNNAEARETKRQRTEKKEDISKLSKPTATKEKAKPGRKRKSSGVGVDSPVVQRGPPLPKSRGLVTLRREEQDNMRITRSGRASYRPLEYWKGEHIEYDPAKSQVFEDKGRHFAMPVMKGIVRADMAYQSAPRRRRGRPVARHSDQRSKSSRRSHSIVEEEVERDDWEHDPGHMVGECVIWRPEHQIEPPEDEVETKDEVLAISESATQLRDVKDSTFLFAKTFTLPFFGSGLVEMPPGSEKRQKNTRKMQMVFFVHTGSVTVNVADTVFQIGKGGTWFVPRGNFYSIKNESDKTSRLFFAQGCEVLVQPEPQGEE
ncbi:Mif2/CENP-C like-domain-containing protein [Xylariaceae sp. FL0662B]|nr:Mif2/CENP-C like-domain-containing protein [Xylariaceae sp. FL0662B]